MLFNQGSQLYFRKKFPDSTFHQKTIPFTGLHLCIATPSTVKSHSGTWDFVRMKEGGKIGTSGAISISKSIYKLFLCETSNCGEETGN